MSKSIGDPNNFKFQSDLGEAVAMCLVRAEKVEQIWRNVRAGASGIGDLDAALNEYRTAELLVAALERMEFKRDCKTMARAGWIGGGETKA